MFEAFVSTDHEKYSSLMHEGLYIKWRLEWARGSLNFNTSFSDCSEGAEYDCFTKVSIICIALQWVPGNAL